MTSKINEAAENAAKAPAPKRRRVPLWLWVAGPLAVAGYLGLLLAPILDRLIVAALAVILVPLLVVVVVDFFRSPD